MLHLKKRGDGLSLNTIVIAVLAVLVLVVLTFIFLNGIGTTNDGFQACDGTCLVSRNDCQQGWVAVPKQCDAGGGAKGSYCCIPLGGQ